MSEFGPGEDFTGAAPSYRARRSASEGLDLIPSEARRIARETAARRDALPARSIHDRGSAQSADGGITTERELQSALYAIRVTGELYASMVEAAFASADRPVDYGLSAEECLDGGPDPLGHRREEKTCQRSRVQAPATRADGPPARRVG